MPQVRFYISRVHLTIILSVKATFSIFYSIYLDMMLAWHSHNVNTELKNSVKVR